LTDRAQYYGTACKFLSLDHNAYGLKARSIMKRIVQYVKGRTTSTTTYLVGRRGATRGMPGCP